MFQELGDGVFRRRYDELDENVGLVIGEEGVLVIDTRSTHAQGDRIRSELSAVTALPVRWVVNTHWHWDHVFGNSRFAGAEIWGHVRTRETLLERPDEMKSVAKDWLEPELHPEIDSVEIVPPDRTFSDRITVDIGRPIDLSFHGLGHTDADIRIAIEDPNVIFLGDLIEEGSPPSFGDSYPLSWPGTLRKAVRGVEGVVVPGHGDVVDAAFVATQIEELEVVAELGERCIGGDLSVEAAIPLGPYPPDFMRSALQRAVIVGT